MICTKHGLFLLFSHVVLWGQHVSVPSLSPVSPSLAGAGLCLLGVGAQPAPALVFSQPLVCSAGAKTFRVN